MKKTIKLIGIIALTMVIGFSITTCDNGSTGGNNNNGNNNGSVGARGKTSTGTELIRIGTAAVDSKLKKISADRTMVFDNLEAEEMPVAGDIICSAPSKAAPYGFLYKVKKVATNDGETVVTTEMASVEEAVENADATQSFDLRLAEGVAERDGIRVIKSEDPNSRKVFEIYNKKYKKEIGPVELEGSINFNASVDSTIKISHFKVQRFEFSVSPRLTADLTATIGANYEKEITFEIYECEFAPITFWAGPVPIVFVPKISIDATVSLEGEVKITAQLVKWDYSYAFGVEYTDGKKLAAFNRNTSKPTEYLNGVNLNMSGEVKLTPKAAFSFALYDMASVGVSASFFAKLEGEAEGFMGIDGTKEASGSLAFSCGLEFAVEAELEILGNKIGGLDYTFYDVEWPIWEKSWGGTTAVTGVKLDHTAWTIDVGEIQILNAAVSPSTASNKRVSWSSNVPQIASVSSTGLIRGINVGTAVIIATTSDGNKTATCNVTVKPAFPGTEANPILLTADSWTTGSIGSGGPNPIWYYFTAVQGKTYYIWWNDSQGDRTHTLNLMADAQYRNGTGIFLGADSAYDTPRTLKAEQTTSVKIKGYPVPYGESSAKTGTFAIAYSTSSTRPDPANTKPGVPANVRVTDVTGSSITIEWDTVPGAFAYKLYQVNPNDKDDLRVHTEEIYTPGVNIIGLNPNTSATFRISAFNEEGEGDPSPPVTGKTSVF